MKPSNTTDEKPDETKRLAFRKNILIGIIICAIALVIGCFIGMNHPSLLSQTASQTSSASAIRQESETQEEADACQHDWTLQYKTVHHDAVTHTETMPPQYSNVTSYHTVCNDCGQIIDGSADAHIAESGHSGYTTHVPITDEVMTSEGYTYEVTDTPAYDEAVPDKLVCTLCGESKTVE